MKRDSKGCVVQPGTGTGKPVPNLSLHASQMNDRNITIRQGQYLAFIYYYEKINRRPPSEADIQRYFNVSPPSVHQMVLSLEAAGHIARTPGQSRSLRVLVPVAELPPLE